MEWRSAVKAQGLLHWAAQCQGKKAPEDEKKKKWHFESCEHKACGRVCCYRLCSGHVSKLLDAFQNHSRLKGEGEKKSPWPTPSEVRDSCRTDWTFVSGGERYTLGMDLHSPEDKPQEMWFFQLNLRTARKRWFWKIVPLDPLRQWPVATPHSLSPIADVDSDSTAIRFETLDASATEYKHMEGLFLGSGLGGGGHRVCKIQRIHNPLLAQQWTVQFLQDVATKESGSVVAIGYHGAGRASVPWQTVAEGINPIYGMRGAAFGKGSYIALCPETAVQYASTDEGGTWTVLGFSLSPNSFSVMGGCIVVYCLPGKVQYGAATVSTYPDSMCALLGSLPILVLYEKQRMFPRYAISFTTKIPCDYPSQSGIPLAVKQKGRARKGRRFVLGAR